jgi:glucose/arabinose dehydrogenase
VSKYRFQLLRFFLLPLLTVSFATGLAQQLEPVFSGLVRPVYALPAPAAPERFYLAQLDGYIHVLEDGVLRAEPFLNLSGRVTALQGEQGFFSFAFHPGFVRNGRLFAICTEAGSDDVVLSEFHASSPYLAESEPVRELLRVTAGEPFHLGGQVAFGPDGYLYASFGDGTRTVERLRTERLAQDLSVLNGKLVRIDVDVVSAGQPYSIPFDNPLLQRSGARGEIFAYGLRNPWKFSFDAVTGELFLSDVGEDRWEEINLISAGGNYGWPLMEGNECFRFHDTGAFADPDCPEQSAAARPYLAPIVAYAHLGVDPLGGQSVTGGHVYRGSTWPEWLGLYFYGDFVSGNIWTFDVADPAAQPSLWLQTNHAISSFVEDAAGELYILTIAGEFLKLMAE